MPERKEYVSRLHFLTADGLPERPHLEQVRLAIAAGLPWIQLRMKKAAYEEVLKVAIEAKVLCQASGTKLIINDWPQVALAAGADGVHLGKNDMPPAEARKLLGPDAIIGATANSLEDVRNAAQQPIDYIGLGPFRFTASKEKLAPVLDTATLATCIHAAGDIPVIAIGGVRAEDVPHILALGAYGMAVCMAIAGAEDVAEAARAFREQINDIWKCEDVEI